MEQLCVRILYTQTATYPYHYITFIFMFSKKYVHTAIQDFKGRMIETSLTLNMVYIAQKCKLDLCWYDRSKSNFRNTPVLD